MKNFMLTSVVLLSAGLYAQDNIVAAADTVNSERMITYSLKEVVVSNATNELVLGELNNKSKKGNFCAWMVKLLVILKIQ